MSTNPSNFSLYNAIIKPLRDADSTQLLLRYLKGPQSVRQDIESEILSLYDQVKPDKVRADLLQYLLPIVGFTSELRNITDRLTDEQLRRLALVAVPLWNQRHTRSGLVNAIRLLTGRAAHVTDWFAYRAILDEVALTGDDPEDLYIPSYSFVGAGAGVTSAATTITLPVPLFTQPGDTLLVFAWSGETNDSKLLTALAPLGWEVCFDTTSATRQQGACLRKKVISHEVGSYTFPMFTRGAGFALAAVMVAYRNLDTDSLVVSAGLTDFPANTSAFSTPSLVQSGVTDVYIGFTMDHSVGSNSTPPVAVTERVDGSATGSSTKHVVVFDAQALALTSGPYNLTLSTTSTGVGVGLVFKIKPRPENDFWIIGGQFSTYDEFTTNIRLMDDGTLDEQLLLDVCRLMRPLDERFEIFLDDFLDTFDGELDKWTTSAGTLGPIVDGALQLQFSSAVIPTIPIVPVSGLHDYNVAFKFMFQNLLSDFRFRFYIDLSGSNGNHFYEIRFTPNGSSWDLSLRRDGSTILQAPITVGYVVPSVWYGLRVHVVNTTSTQRSIRVLLDNNQVVPISGVELLDTNADGPAFGNIQFFNINGVAGRDVYIDNVELWRNPGRLAIIDISTPTERGGAVTMTSNFIQ